MAIDYDLNNHVNDITKKTEAHIQEFVTDPLPTWDQYMHFSPEQRAAYSKEYAEWIKRNSEHKERFAVYELPDRKGVYAIWDNESKQYNGKRGFYQDENGNIETFTEISKAEAYRNELILNSDEKRAEIKALLSAKTAFERLKSGDMMYLDNAIKPVQLVSIRQNEVLFVVPALAVEITRTHEQVMEYLQKHKGNKHLLDAVEAELKPADDRFGDKFYVNKENQTVTWIYFNPDSEAGGQYVHNKFDFALIEEAVKENETAEDIFDYIGSVCRQELTDIDSEDFAEVDWSFKNDPFDFENCTSETIDALKSLAVGIQPVNHLHDTDNNEVIPSHTVQDILPDNAIGLSERDLYGYTHDSMLPLLKDRALELYDADNTIYMLYSDGAEAMVFEREEISNHDGILGITAEDWIASKEYADAVKALDNGEASKEAMLIFGKENAYAIYQLKSGDEMKNYRFEPFDSLQNKGLSVERGNYTLVYSASLNDSDTPDSLYAKFNFDRPEYFTGHSLSVSDIIVMQREGVVTSHYVDSFGFQKLTAFLGNEYAVGQDDNQRYAEHLLEHIETHTSAGYFTEIEEKILNENIDSLDEKMTAISNLYENGMPLDVETDTISRIFREELDKSQKQNSRQDMQSTDNSGVKKAKPSILSQLEKNKLTLSQGKETEKNATKRNNNKEEV